MQIGGRIQNLLMGVAGQFKGIRPFLSGDRRHLHEADFAGSTAAMTNYVMTRKPKQVVLITECSMADNILASAPQAEMLRMCSVRCPHMAEITVEDTLLALLKTQFVVDVPEDIRVRAYKSVERMLQIGHTGPRD